MRLTVVGCAPAYTRRTGRASSCYLVEHGDAALALDMGQGSFAELARYRAPETLAGVLISHLHADHLVDLIPLRHYLRYDTKRAKVTLHGPIELRRRMDGFQAERDFLAPLPGDELRPGTLAVGRFEVEAGQVTHIPDSFAFRVAHPVAGPGLVYSGDCGVADDLLPLVQTGDTLLCEAALGARTSAGGMHLTAAEAASVAARAGAARLVLTHILDSSDEVDAARAATAAFAGEVILARPGLVLDFG